MKSAIIISLLLSICFLPQAISARPPFIRLPTDEAEYDPVLDKDGFPVLAGLKYYAIASPIGVQGGISLTSFEYPPPRCPHDVVLNLSIPGEPPPSIRLITFSPEFFETVLENVRLNVAFYEPNQADPCANETLWKLDNRNVIVTGGVFGDPDTWFTIQRSNVGPTKSYVFYRIGTVDDPLSLPLRRLGINDNAYPFQFLRADD